MDRLTDDLRQPLAQLLLSVADDKFLLGHRNADWTGLAPILEEDIAFSSLAQDELSHATALYQLAAELLGTTADKLAFGRKPEEYRCAQLVELSDEFNWATALCRNFFCPSVVATQNNFRNGAQTCPAADSVPLSDSDVAHKRFRYSKNSQHAVRAPVW